MVEFTDYQCPFCQRFHLTIFPKIKKNYIDTGRLRFFSRDLPLAIHANAVRAAQAARCAGDQGQFWGMRDRLQSNPEKLNFNEILNYAKHLELNGSTFQRCLETEKYKSAVSEDLTQARTIGVRGTPAFVIGRTTAEALDGQLLLGAKPYEVFEETFEALQH